MEAQREFEMMEASMQSQYEPEHDTYEGNDSSSSGGGGFIRNVAATATGDYIGERLADRKRAQREKELEEERRREYQRQESERKREAARESQRQWEAVRKANIERKRKGQPELPLPPRSWY